ncbi:MAG: mannosyltransferase family protein [Patescibacteria group bacterium]
MMFLIIIAIWRLVLFCSAYFAQIKIPFVPRFPYADVYLVPSQLPQWLWGWANFDGVHYLTIAKFGYKAQFTQVYFPLFPLLLRGLGRLFADDYLILSGLFVSFVCFIGAIYVFQRLLDIDYGYNVNKFRILLMQLVFPTSFFFAALYTESLFLLLVMLSFLLARKKKWWLCAAVGSLATFTRITGIFLLPALLWEFFQDHKSKNQENSKNIKNSAPSSLIIKGFQPLIRSPILYLLPIGLISYMVYLQIFFGDALYFWHAQGVFGAERAGHSLVFPLQTLWRYIKIITTVSNGDALLPALMELGAFLLGVVLLVKASKSVRISYLIFSWLVLFVPLLTGTLSSLPRYVLLAFPIYIVLGKIKSNVLFSIVVFIFTLLLIYLTSRFISGRWVA